MRVGFEADLLVAPWLTGPCVLMRSDPGGFKDCPADAPLLHHFGNPCVLLPRLFGIMLRDPVAGLKSTLIGNEFEKGIILQTLRSHVVMRTAWKNLQLCWCRFNWKSESYHGLPFCFSLYVYVWLESKIHNLKGSSDVQSLPKFFGTSNPSNVGLVSARLVGQSHGFL